MNEDKPVVFGDFGNMEWISIKDRLPEPGIWQQVWAFDGENVFICEWGQIEDDYYKKFAPTKGFWFGIVDGTETFTEQEGVTHWMEIIWPNPPKVK